MKQSVSIVSAFVGLLFAATSGHVRAEITDIVIGAADFRDKGKISPDFVEIVDDNDAWEELALDVTGGVVGIGKLPPEPAPEAWASVEFQADAARYYVWLHGQAPDIDSDSVWIQFDDEIGTANQRNPDIGFANWRDFAAADKYAWGSSLTAAWAITFDEGGLHEMQLQPRQAPHTIDQIWLSTHQNKQPDPGPVDLDAIGAFAVDPEGKLATTWASIREHSTGRSQ